MGFDIMARSRLPRQNNSESSCVLDDACVLPHPRLHKQNPEANERTAKTPDYAKST